MFQTESEKKGAKFRLPFVWTVALVVLSVDLIVIFLGYVWLQQNRQQYQDRAIVMSQNISRLLEQSIADSIERAELSLQSVNDEITKQVAAGGIDKHLLNAFIARQHARLPDLEGIRLTDTEGVVLYGVNVPDNGIVNIADDPHFQYLRDNADALPVITKPRFGRISKKWTIRVARRYNHKDGSFAGVLTGIIDLDYFEMMFSSLNVGSKGAIALRDSDLGIISRYPKHEDAASIVGNNKVSQHYRDLLKAQPYKGTFIAISMLDGVERTYSYQKVGKWPLYIQVGLATEDTLADWRKARNNGVLVAFLFLLLSSVMALITYRYWRDRKKFLDEMERNRRKFLSFAEMSSDWFWEQDSNFRFIGVTGDVSKKYGVSRENFEGKTRSEIAVDLDDEKWEEHRTLLEAHQPFRDYEYCVIDEKGERRHISVSGEPVFGVNGEFQGYRGVGKDITDRRQYENRIQHMAQFDSLTDLPNRALFHDRLKQAIKFARRDQHEFALLYFDLDKFKPVNDEFGHAAGDQLLKQVAWRVRALLRESDTVARLGGDEFAALLPRTQCRQDSEEVSKKLIQVLRLPFILENVAKDVYIGVSIGIAIFPQDADNADCLIKNADAAMYQSKQTRNCYHFYSDKERNRRPDGVFPSGN